MLLLRLSLVVSIIVASGRLAHADDATAKRHFDAAAKAYNLQRFDEALTEFRAAYQERADPALLFNIAQAQRQLGQYDAAARSYRAYLHEQPDAPNRDDVAHWITEMDEAARKQLAATAPPAASPPIPTATATPSTGRGVDRDDGRSLRLAGAIVAGAGIAGVGLGIAFAVLSKQAGDAAYRPANDVYDPSADERQRSFRTADIVCFSVAGALVVGGGVVWLVGRQRRHERVVAGAGATW